MVGLGIGSKCVSKNLDDVLRDYNRETIEVARTILPDLREFGVKGLLR